MSRTMAPDEVPFLRLSVFGSSVIGTTSKLAVLGISPKAKPDFWKQTSTDKGV